MPCHSPYFSVSFPSTPSGFMTFWLAIWSTLCALSTMVTISTFLMDSYRFQYPELPIVYLSICYFMVSIGYLIRVFLGHESIACDVIRPDSRTSYSLSNPTESDDDTLRWATSSSPLAKTTTGLNWLHTPTTTAVPQLRLLRHALTGRASCAAVFLLTYYFGIASAVWWVVLTLTWFLAAGLKWGSEAISKYSQAHQFYPLVQINCSEDLRFFLCSIYTPICIDGFPSFLPPCRSICERVQAGCAPVMQHYHFPWPERLNCAQFPKYNNPEGVLCMERNLTEADSSVSIRNSTVSPFVAHQRMVTTLTDFNARAVKQPISTPVVTAKQQTKMAFNAEASDWLRAFDQQNQTIKTLLEHRPELRLRCTCNCQSPMIRLSEKQDSYEFDKAHQFYPLVQINCSEDLRFFLCSIYTPICIDGFPSFLPPCRSICERVQAGCAPVMQHYHFPWPERLNCAQFPKYNNPEG
ncbi:hypothetical protein AHF37_12352, partial [Paragonimus kellicotti]